MWSSRAILVAGSLFSLRAATAQSIVPPPVRVVPPTVGAVAPLLPSGAYRLTLTVPPSPGAPSITRHARGALVHTGNAIAVHIEHSLTLRGTLTGNRLDVRTADGRGDTLALALTATDSHAVGTVAIAGNARRTTGTATLEPDVPASVHDQGAASARNRDGDGTCRNLVLCLIRDLFGISIDTDR